MSSLFFLRRAFWPHLGICLGVCTVALLAPSTTRAQDPVEELRQALRLGSTESLLPPALVKKRKELVEASRNKLQTIAHYRRAYVLEEWYKAPPPETPVKGDDIEKDRREIGTLLTHVIQKNAADADPARRLAIAFVIAELADSDHPDVRKGKFARGFTAVARTLATDQDVNVRRAGLHAIGKIMPKPGDVIQTLKDTLAKDELAPRRLAAYALTDLVKNAKHLRIEDDKKREHNEELDTIEQVIAAAAGALSDSDEHVRGYCLQSIHEAAKALNDCLDTPIPQVVLDKNLKATFDALKKSNGPVLQTLQDPTIKIRLAALQALDQVGVARAKLLQTTDVSQRLRDLPAEKRRFTSQLFDGIATADPFHNIVKGEWRILAALLDDGNVRVRRGAIDLLEQLGDELTPAAEQDIARALLDKDWLVRWSAARTIRHIPAKDVSSKAVAALARVLKDHDPDLSATATVTMQGLGSHVANAVAALDKRERDETLDALAFAVTNGGKVESRRDADNRLAAMRMLVSIGGAPAQHAIPKLIDALTDPDVRIRRAAAETLGQFGPAAKDALPALRAALNDENNDVRLFAGEAILSIETRKKDL